jgi:hypothetical protein
LLFQAKADWWKGQNLKFSRYNFRGCLPRLCYPSGVAVVLFSSCAIILPRPPGKCKFSRVTIYSGMGVLKTTIYSVFWAFGYR